MLNASLNADFYTKVLKIITKAKIPFMVGGGWAVFEYTGFNHPTQNDFDIFCKAGDYPKIISILEKNKINVKVQDERWLAKAWKEDYVVDILFSAPNYLITVDDSWFKYSRKFHIFGMKLNIIPKEELIWCKAYVQERNRYDGADINHIILNSGKELDWKRLLMRMESSWEILFGIILNFRFVYPSYRDIIPSWLMKEFISRLNHQMKNPTPIDKICRGPLLSRSQYKHDLDKLGFETIF